MTDNVKELQTRVRSLERQLKSARLEICNMCQCLGEDICKTGEGCDYKESEGETD